MRQSIEASELNQANGVEPTISVILPVRNGEIFLSLAVESVLNQTFQDLELLIVVNASTDRTLEIARDYEAQDRRVRVFHSNEPGASTALNLGVSMATGSWFARMDADDIWLPEKLERQWAFCQANPDIDVVGTYGWLISETGKRLGMFRVGPTTREEFALLRNENSVIYLLSPSTMFSRKAAEHTGGHDPSYVRAQDIEYWTRIADEFCVLTLPEPLVLYRVHSSSSSTRTFFQQSSDAARVLANVERRRSGVPELSGEEFAAHRAQRPLLVKWREKKRWQSHYWYRHGGGLIGAGKPKGLFWLFLGGVLDPSLVIQRILRQRVFSTLRGTST